MKTQKFLVSVEFGERTRWRPECEPGKLERHMALHLQDLFAVATTGPEPRVNVIEDERKEASREG